MIQGIFQLKAAYQGARLCALAVTIAMICIAPAFADDPAPAGAAPADSPPPFDRPGIAFAPAVLPAGSFDWEQGLPDWTHDSSDGVRVTDYTFDTNLRYGLSTNFEMQLAGSLFNRLDVNALGQSAHVSGGGDTRLSLKWAPTLSAKGLSFAMLGSVTFDTGSPAFTSGTDVYSLGGVLGKDLGGGRSIAGYINDDHADGLNTWTAQTNFGFPINGNLGGYVEIAHIWGNGTPNPVSVAGGGVTYLVNNRLQFDLYARHGLTSDSPDIEAGFGVSLFFK